MDRLLKYDDFLIEESIQHFLLEEISFINVEQVKKEVIDYLKRITNKDKILIYFNKLVSAFRKLPHNLKIAILVAIIPIFSNYITTDSLFNELEPQIQNEVRLEINKSEEEVKKSKKDNFILSQNGWDFIKDHEKLKLKAYNLGDGMITVGWGHAERENDSKYQVGDVITKGEAQKLIQKDMKVAADGIRRILNQWKGKGIDVELNQNQFDALVSLAFNCGVQSIRDSDFIQEIKKGNLEKAGEMIKTFNLNDKFKGLEHRRKKESELFLK